MLLIMVIKPCLLSLLNLVYEYNIVTAMLFKAMNHDVIEAHCQLNHQHFAQGMSIQGLHYAELTNLLP